MNIKLYKILKINFLIFITLGINLTCVYAQIFDSNQTPLSVKWRKISNHDFKLIYPKELEKEAQRMANSFSYIYPAIGRDFNLKTTNIPIVFQNRSTIANGFVQLAPKKGQFYTTPSQQFDSQDWLNNLAVHELRHVAQYDKITGGKTRLIDEILFGYIGAAIPIWFLEGDAVSIETSLTDAGRGRQPNWIMPYRTSLLNHKKLSYSKAYFGSNKDIELGYYQTGYLMVSELRNRYGEKIINDIFTDLHQRLFRLYPFSNTLRMLTGKSSRKYFLQTQEKIRLAWEKQDKQIESETYSHLNKTASFESNYYFPAEIAKGKILALKKTKAQVGGFVIIDQNKKEKTLFKIAYQETPFFSFANNVIAWDEIREDPRYKNRTYNVICTYNMILKKKKRLSFKSRLFSPALSPDGTKIIAVQIGLNNQNNLVLIDAQTGQILKVFENTKNDILQTPTIDQNGMIAWVSVTEEGKSLWVLKTNGESIQLIKNVSQQLERPTINGNNIYFNAHFSGINNIYEIAIDSKKISALTASRYGAFNPSITSDKKSILFNDYGLTGYNMAKTAILPKDIPSNGFVFLGEAAQRQENTGNVFTNIPDSIYISKPYHPLKHLFNFHSISPDFDDNGSSGLLLKSNDLLNNMSFYTGIYYHSDLKKPEYKASLSFKALYPIINITYRNRPKQTSYLYKNVVYQTNWRENYLDLTLSLPLSFNAYNHQYGFIGNVATYYTQRNFAPREQGLLKDKIVFPLEYRFSFIHKVRKAERDFTPRWAQVLNFKYLTKPFDKNLQNNLFTFESFFYFPGFFPNHSFMLSYNYQTNGGNVVYGNEINTGFGYAKIKAKSPLQNTFFAIYRMPIFFPDWEIASLAYIKNIRAGTFINYENIGIETNLNQPKTFGLELLGGMNLFRYLPEFDLGGRIIYVNKTYGQKPIYELLIKYNF